MRHFIVLFFVLFSYATTAKEIQVTTSSWQPYIKDTEVGSAAELLQQIYSQNDTSVIWLRQNYDLAFQQIAQGKKLASFPYFKTQERASQVLYSKPVFKVSSFIYFNRQFNPAASIDEIDTAQLGRVAGYSYGEAIDKLLGEAKVYADERTALSALLSGAINFLPMTESVMNYLLNNEFSSQKLLVKPLSNIESKASLHLIAPNSKQGKAVINELNTLIDGVAGLASFNLTTEPLKIAPDLAKLTSSEGYPVILAQSDLSDSPDYYTLALGTKVLVLKWSDKLLKPAKSDRIYKNMMDVSKVVILNGPLVGKEVYIRNMHIELI